MKISEEASKSVFTPATLLVGVILLITAGVCTAASSTDKPAATTQPTEKQLADARALFRWLLGPPLSPTEKDRAEKLVRDLGDNRWKVRQKASEELFRLGQEVVPLLQQAAKGKDVEASARARLILEAFQDRSADISNNLNHVIDTLAAAQDKKLVAMLIRLLDNVEPCVRYTAEYGLRRVTGKNLGYNSYDDPPKRAQAVGRWRQWWKQNQAGFALKKQQPVGILICDESNSSLTAVLSTGKILWSRRLEKKFRCAAGLPNGNVLVGYDDGQIIEYDPQFKQVWPSRRSNLGSGPICDISRLGNGNTLVAYRKHVSEVTRTGKIVWQVKNLDRPRSVQRLGDGNTLLTNYGRCQIIEVNRAGKIVWEKRVRGRLCDAVKLPNGNVLKTCFNEGMVAEYNQAGKVVWQQKCPNRPFSLCRLPNGTTAINCQRAGAIVMDCQGRTIRWLLNHGGYSGKIRIVPAAVLEQKQSAISSQPSAKPKK